MNKKEIIITIIVGIVFFLLSMFIVFSIKVDKKEKISSKTTTTTIKQNETIQFMNYILHVGKYTGEEYDGDTKREVTLEIDKTSITRNGVKEEYILREDFIYINGVEMYQVTNNDEIKELVGGGTVFKYEN